MKKIITVVAIMGGIYIASCKNNDTATQMPNEGYKERSDTGTSMPSGVEDNSRGAVAVDSVKNGQAGVSSIPDTTKK